MRVRRQMRRISTIYSHPIIFLATLREACTRQHFTADCCLLAPGAGAVERLYERYKQWADDNNLRELSDTAFALERKRQGDVGDAGTCGHPACTWEQQKQEEGTFGESLHTLHAPGPREGRVRPPVRLEPRPGREKRRTRETGTPLPRGKAANAG